MDKAKSQNQPTVAEISAKFGGADQLRNAVKQLQSLFHAARIVCAGEVQVTGI